MKLVKPSEEHAIKVMAFRDEFLVNNDSMDGTAGLVDYTDYGKWLERVEQNNCKDTVMEGLVPASTYLAVRETDKRLMGMVDVRHELNEYLYNFGGHIGYCVRQSERGKGYATEILRLALGRCDELVLSKVLICCYKENVPSVRTIVSNGGILENEVMEDSDIIQRYWISIQ